MIKKFDEYEINESDSYVKIGTPDGFIKSFDRDSCWKCKYFYNNSGKVPKQEVMSICKKVTPLFEVQDEDVCDLFE